MESPTKGSQSSYGEVPTSAQGQLIFTRDSASGAITRIEKVDDRGLTNDLTQDECLQIAGEDEVEELNAALDAAFEAGMLDVLGEDDSEETAESYPILERLILLRILTRRSGRDLSELRRDMMRRLVLRRLVRRHVLRSYKERTT